MLGTRVLLLGPGSEEVVVSGQLHTMDVWQQLSGRAAVS